MKEQKTSSKQRVKAITLPGLVNPHDLSTDRQFSMSMARGFAVLRAFTPASPVLSNGEIADRTTLPRPTVSRLTYTLTLLGYLSHDKHLRKYRLGSGVLTLGYPLLASMHIRQLAKPAMEALARGTGCTVNLGIRDRDSVVYVDSVRADRSNQHLPDIGSSRPLMAAAIGRTLMLACPLAERTAILNYLKIQDRAMFDSMHDIWVEDEKRFAAEGYCHSRGDWRKEVHAIAMPIRQAHGQPQLAINCTIAAHEAQSDRLVSEVLPLMRDTVRQIELSLGML
ncbi:IclR family transcriptional regulator [Pusillimonas sp. MFBS29]|uniref:IclR family transcriptional regulator n=1 Tax=Pusillimonas sp. MFBS29 TaxID=2886690 RepID=UPI001D10C52F|nr:IclR family transcriptional regulator [Pusillimonas sp. MFBS29]MCC2595406.1 IclR family transcriptional regulator [Pusillimonas sp. MFBS29]